ncbi:MAG: DUF3667 domain-containing protein [Cyclobacteriaceae bacterium]|jgi:hypothetical protein|nr:DUF3667 domain-containing protein [Cyclobacteriaceae bacterium]
MNEALTHRCKSCENTFTGNYCNHCGEKVLVTSDQSFKSVVNSILLTITFVDTRFIKTLWMVLTTPGTLSRDFSHGKRIKRLSPMSLFFLLNLVYFFFPLIQLFNASLHTQLLSPLSVFYINLITHKIVTLGLDLNSFTLIYNQKTTSLAKLMVVVFVVISSLPLNILYWKKNKYFIDHVTYAVELACFNLFANAILLTVIVRLFGLGHYLNEITLTVIFIITNLYFILRSGLTFYQEKGIRLVFKSLILIVFLKLALEGYRMVLFFVTMWML